MENENVEKKWYQKTWGIIVLFIIFPPVGLYFLWKSDLSKNSKLIQTVIFALSVLLSIGNNEYTEQSTTLIPNTDVHIVTSSIRMTDEGLKAKIIGADNQKYTILFVKGNNGKMDLSSSIFFKLYKGWDNLANPETGVRGAYMTKILEFMRANQ